MAKQKCSTNYWPYDQLFFDIEGNRRNQKNKKDFLGDGFNCLFLKTTIRIALC